MLQATTKPTPVSTVWLAVAKWDSGWRYVNNIQQFAVIFVTTAWTSTSLEMHWSALETVSFNVRFQEARDP